jgi:phosphopantetheinyl transferase
MPIIRIDTVGDGRARLGLWKMTESIDDLPQPQNEDLSQYHSKARKLEKLVTYALVKEMTGEQSPVITHEENGRPLLNEWNIGISHTRGWLAVILSRDCRVSVDIEYQSDRVNRIASHFIRPDETPADRLSRLIDWCAKETAYKFFWEEDLLYFDMRLKPFDISENGVVEVEDLKTKKSLPVNVVTNNDYVLTWAVG